MLVDECLLQDVNKSDDECIFQDVLCIQVLGLLGWKYVARCIEDWGCYKMYGDECVFEDVYNIILKVCMLQDV